MKRTKTASLCPDSFFHVGFQSLTYQSHWCHLWPSSWPSLTSSSCLATASAAAPPSQGASAEVQLSAEVLAAGIVVVVEEAAMPWIGWLLLVEKVVGEPVGMGETSCWEEEEAAVEVVDVGVAFLMEPTRVESFEGWSGWELEGRSCDPWLLQTSPLLRGSSPALTFAFLCLVPPCVLCSVCTWPGWAGWAL